MGIDDNDNGPPHPLSPPISPPHPRVVQILNDKGSAQPANNGPSTQCWIEDYADEAGTTYGHCTDSFNKHYKEQKKRGDSPWSPFASYEDWKLAKWVMTAGISQAKIDSLLALPSIFKKAKPSFHNARSLLKLIDALPHGPEFKCQVLEITGDEKDEHSAF
ncbi:hypothetical protein H0H92_007747 [Tricholoma furcatifolium]|nr:hypothetical protein H0H92_007747 [Tricholoma furcatifolium]